MLQCSLKYLYISNIHTIYLFINISTYLLLNYVKISHMLLYEFYILTLSSFDIFLDYKFMVKMLSTILWFWRFCTTPLLINISIGYKFIVERISTIHRRWLRKLSANILKIFEHRMQTSFAVPFIYRTNIFMTITKH